MLYRDPPQVIVHSLDPLENMTAYLQGVIARQQAKSQEAIPPIKIDVLEDSRAYIVKADLPGAQKENIRVAIEGNQVSINTDLSAQPSKESVESKASGLALLHSERYHGAQSRTFALAHEVDENESQAKYENGILTLTLPKKSSAKVKQLSIE
jgi:HSP20 family protein